MKPAVYYLEKRERLADLLQGVKYQKPVKAIRRHNILYADWFTRLRQNHDEMVYIILVDQDVKFIGWTTGCPYSTIARHFSGSIASSHPFVVDKKDYMKTEVGMIYVEQGMGRIFSKAVTSFLWAQKDFFFLEDGLFDSHESIEKALNIVSLMLEDVENVIAGIDALDYAKKILLKIQFEYPTVYPSRVLHLLSKAEDLLPF